MPEISVVTIDGPSGVGKSTVSKSIAAATGFIYLDTGAMYRAAGLHLMECDVDNTDQSAIAAALQGVSFGFYPPRDSGGDIGVLLNGRDVSELIRTPEMAMVASRVSAVPVVREILTEKQREYGEKGGVVAEGRDTGTVVFPQAAYKFYLDAEPEERAKRRIHQFRQQGTEVDYHETLAMIIERDKNDSERTIAPLRMAEDAFRIDTTSLSLDEVVDLILMKIHEKEPLLPIT